MPNVLQTKKSKETKKRIKQSVNTSNVRRIDVNYAKKVFIGEILKFREELAITPVPSDCVPLTVAAELCTIGVTGNLVSHLMTLQKEGDKMAEVDWFDAHFSKLLVLGVIALFMVIAFLVVKNSGGA